MKKMLFILLGCGLLVVSCKPNEIVDAPDVSKPVVGKDHRDGVKFDGERLVFPDGKTFGETYVWLAERGLDTAVTEPVAAGIGGRLVGFRSLYHQLEDETDSLEAMDALTLENLPDLGHTPDPFLQALLNVRGEVQIGDSVFHFDQVAGEGDAKDARGSCCVMYRYRNQFQGNSNPYFMYSQSWVYNFPVPLFWFGTVGSRTRSYVVKTVAGKQVVYRQQVSQIGTSCKYRKTILTCENGNQQNGNYSKINFHSQSVEKINSFWTGVVPFFVTEHSAYHAASFYNGTYFNGYTSVCD